jgi:hypothetical protein
MAAVSTPNLTVTRRTSILPSPSEDAKEAPEDNPELRSAAWAEVNAKASTVDQPPEDPGDVSVTNSEVESVMNHWRRKETLRHSAFSDQEFNAFSSVDVCLGEARTGRGSCQPSVDQYAGMRLVLEPNMNPDPVAPEP